MSLKRVAEVSVLNAVMLGCKRRCSNQILLQVVGYSDLVQETVELQHLGLSIGSGCSEDELQEIGEMEQCGLAVGGSLSEDELQETEELSSFGCMDGLNVTPSIWAHCYMKVHHSPRKKASCLSWPLQIGTSSLGLLLMTS